MWQVLLGSPPGTMCVSDGVAYIPTGDRKLHAIGLEKAELKWSQEISSGAAGQPGCAMGRVHVAGRSGRLYVLDALSGNPVATHDASGAALTGVTVGDGRVLYGDDERWFYACDPVDGSLLWKLKTKANVATTAVIGGGRCYFSTEDSIYAVELE